MRIVVAVLLLLTLLSGGVQNIASAQSNDPTASPDAQQQSAGSVRMDVRAGFDGAGRVGGWVPLNVQLVNEGAELKAKVEVIVDQPGGRSTYSYVPTTYSMPVVLPRLSNRTFSMDANLPNATNNRLTARLVSDPGGELITEQDINMTRVPLGDYFCGVLARDPSSYDFLAALDLPPPIRRVRTAPLDPTTVPERAQLLGSFDCLIIDNAATAQLRPEQLEAIQVWVGTGGLLIEVGGSTWQNTLGPLPPDLLPVDPSGLANVQSLSALGDLMGTPMDAQGPWLVSQSRPRTDRGAHVVVSQDGVPLIAASKSGDGTLMYLGFEPTTRNFRAWSGNDALWRYLITHAAVDNGVGSALVRPYLRWGGRAPRLAMADFSTHPKPTLDWFWVLVGAYGVSLSGSLFFFGRRGMVGWGIISVVGLTLGAGALAFVVARAHAEPDAAVTRVIVVRPINVGNSSAAYTHEYLSVLARRDGNFNFLLPSEDLARGLYFPFPRPSDESDSTWPFRVGESAQQSLDHLQLKQGQLATAQVDGQLKQAPGVQADLLVENGALTGTVTNRTGGRLSDAYIVVDSDFRSLGTLEKDQASQVDFLLPQQAAAGNMAATAIADKLTPPGSSGKPGASARRDLLESLFSARFLFQRMELRGPTLVGWLQQPPNQLDAPDFHVSNADFTLLVQPLQAQLPIGFEGEVPAAAMNRRDLGIQSGAPTDRDYYTVAPGEAVTLQFTIPPSEGSFRLEQLRLNLDAQVTGRVRQTQMPFAVQLFNWRSAEWQTWEVGNGSSIVPDGDRYISAAGEVRLRYMLDASLQSTIREVRLNRLDVTAVGAIH
ncbi:MAG: hypothetical protein JOY61_14620 [Chloroflexi bacterium]|nr:hypothetical protein [Chloroflexota bacterium]